MHIVIGAGEVGQAIVEVLAEVYEVHLRDIVDEADAPPRAQVLHICYPWSGAFVASVQAYREHYDPELVIVHSTVPVGTCDELGVVHSPVRGRHPHLTESVRTFTKFVGGAQSTKAAAYFERAGVPTWTTDLAATTEAGKLWELTQFGLAVVVEQQIHQYCVDLGLDFDVVYTQFARSYNEGYRMLGEPQFVRPVIAHMPGPIGGHCVVPGAALLEHAFGDIVAELGVVGAERVAIDLDPLEVAR